MKAAACLAVAGLVAIGGVALGQVPGSSSPNSPVVLPPGFHSTTWITVNQSLTELLDSGYKINSSMGPAMTLEKDGKYILCEIHPNTFSSDQNGASSACHAIN